MVELDDAALSLARDLLNDEVLVAEGMDGQHLDRFIRAGLLARHLGPADAVKYQPTAAGRLWAVAMTTPEGIAEDVLEVYRRTDSAVLASYRFDNTDSMINQLERLKSLLTPDEVIRAHASRDASEEQLSRMEAIGAEHF